MRAVVCKVLSEKSEFRLCINEFFETPVHLSQVLETKGKGTRS